MNKQELDGEFAIRGVSCSKADFIKELQKHGGEIFTLGACESNRISKAIRTDGNRVWKED